MPVKRNVARSTLPVIPALVAAAEAEAQALAAASAAATSSSSSTSKVQFASSVDQLWRSYVDTTPKNLKLLDTLQLFLMLTGVVQFAYCVLVTNYPFNAFLGGFSATVGQFVLTASMRSQVNPENKEVFPTISPERAFADFIFGSMILHFFVFSYLG